MADEGDGRISLELRVSGCKIRSPLKIAGAPASGEVHMGEDLPLDLDLAFPPDDIPVEVEAALASGGGFVLAGGGPFKTADLPQSPGDSPLRETIASAGEGGDEAWTLRRLTLVLRYDDADEGALMIEGDVLHKDYGTSLDSLAPVELAVLPPRLNIGAVEVKAPPEGGEGWHIVRTVLSTSLPGKVKGTLEGGLVPSTQKGDRPWAVKLGPVNISVKEETTVEWEVDMGRAGAPGGAMDVVLVFKTRKHGTLVGRAEGIFELRLGLDCRVGSLECSDIRPSPGDAVTFTATVENLGREGARFEPGLRLLAGERTSEVAGEPFDLAAGGSREVRWEWSVPRDWVGGGAGSILVDAQAVLRTGDGRGGVREFSMSEGEMLEVAPAVALGITGLSSRKDRAVPGEDFPVELSIVNEGKGESVEAQVALKVWTSAQLARGGEAGGAVPSGERPLFKASRKATVGRRPKRMEFIVPVPEAGSEELGGADHGGAGSLAVEVSAEVPGQGAVARLFPSFATITGKSKIRVDVLRFQPAVDGDSGEKAGGSGAVPGGAGVKRRGRADAADVPEHIAPYLFADEKVVETVRGRLLTHHRLNSNTYIYDYNGEVVDSLEWRKRGRGLLPFYNDLFRNVLHGGKYSQRRLERLARAADHRGMLISGICQRMLEGEGGTAHVGSVVFTETGEDGPAGEGKGRRGSAGKGRGPRAGGRGGGAGTYSPGRWRVWCLGDGSKGSKGRGMVHGIAGAFGMSPGRLAKGALPLGFIGGIVDPGGMAAPAAGEGKAGRAKAGAVDGPTASEAFKGVREALEDIEALFKGARSAVRKAGLEKIDKLFDGLAHFTGDAPPSVESPRDPLEELTDAVTLKGARAIRAAGLATCFKAAFMARSSRSLERMVREGDEPFVDLLNVIRSEYYIHILDTLTGKLLEAGGEYGKDLTSHLLLCKTSAFATLSRDSRVIYREFLRRAHRYITNMEVRNTLAAVRGPVRAVVGDRELEYVLGSETGTTVGIDNPTGQTITVRAGFILPEKGLSIVEPEAGFADGLHLLPAMAVPPNGTREIPVTFFASVGGDIGDAGAGLVVMPAKLELLTEMGGAGTQRDAD